MGVAESAGMVGGAGAAGAGARDLVAEGVEVAVARAELLEGVVEGEGPDGVLPDPATIAARTTTSASRTASPAASHSRRRLSMTGTYHSAELKTRARKPQFGHKGCLGTVRASRQNNVLGARWDLNLSAFTWAGFAVSYPFRHGGSFAPELDVIPPSKGGSRLAQCRDAATVCGGRAVVAS